MALDTTDLRLAQYVGHYIAGPNKGEAFLYNEDNFYNTLIRLEVPTMSDELLILLYKVYSEGYDKGYDDGY